MIGWLIFLCVTILVCVFLNNASSKVGVPVLLLFILFGIAMRLISTPEARFNDMKVAETTCTIALIFIMFYGGFGTNWKSAKCIVKEAGLLASLGVVATAGLTGLLCHFFLGWGWVESLLMGSVISSTDAASVFSILRSKHLGLKNNIAPMLEMESGSNDPCSYMLTIIMLALMKGEASGGAIVLTLVKQLVFGTAFALIIAQAAVFAMRRFSFATSGFDSLFVLAVAIASYAVPSAVGGNGYLSAYIVGIIMGNNHFRGKKQLVSFFDGVTGLMQVVIFFMLGLLARVTGLGHELVPALILFAAIFFVARPVSVIAVLAPFKKYSLKQMLFISFVGLRGAASIVFAIMACSGNALVEHDIFSVVFVIVLISIALQGSLIPRAAAKLDVIDDSSDVMKTFTDFADETNMYFSQIKITPDSSWNGIKVMQLNPPKNVLLCLIIRPDGERVVPNGQTVISEGDTVIMCANAASGEQYIHLVEHPLSQGSKWAGHMVKEYPHNPKEQLVLIKRGDRNVVPHGDTVLMEGDILVINKG